MGESAGLLTKPRYLAYKRQLNKGIVKKTMDHASSLTLTLIKFQITISAKY